MLHFDKENHNDSFNHTLGYLSPFAVYRKCFSDVFPAFLRLSYSLEDCRAQQTIQEKGTNENSKKTGIEV